MTGVALWLLLIGVVDLARGRRDAAQPRVLAALAVTMVAVSLLLALSLRPTGVGWTAWLLAALAGAGWVLGSGVSAARFRAAAPAWLPSAASAPASAAVAYVSLGLGLGSLLLAGPAAGTAPGLDAVLAGSGLASIPPQRTLLLAALLVVQVSTANVIVRMLLDLVGVPASDNEKQLRGGRVLGPMERLVVLGLGTAGSLIGAAFVVAAKAILRFPELRVPRAGDPGYGGPSDVTEYFLVGSFASWLVALGSVGLLFLVPV
ncbi:MAG TPA: hypothetical protein VFU98_03850 [Microlunatus sp.]|nr:hypothetical protein [Microlunatus sp.]